MLPPLIQIDDILVSTEIISECFCCDYPVCKGACCIIGDSGAPMNIFARVPFMQCEDEEEVLRSSYEKFKPLMSDAGRKAVGDAIFSVIDSDSDQVTPLVPGTEECAYCHFDEKGNCMCSVQLAGVRKPVSCSLYPIRTKLLRGGLLALNLHHWDICKCAFDKGRADGVRVYEFLRGPLVEAFGQEFYDALDAARREFEN